MCRLGQLFNGFNISIPSGTIKRCTALPELHNYSIFQFLLVRLKVQIAGTVSDEQIAFQFLLVRLKAFWFIHTLFDCCISIPSGTIKSVEGTPKKRTELLFQFLLVRLKVLIFCHRHRLLVDFNSFWYD